jgi:hypothetical protein
MQFKLTLENIVFHFNVNYNNYNYEIIITNIIIECNSNMFLVKHCIFCELSHLMKLVSTVYHN